MSVAQLCAKRNPYAALWAAPERLWAERKIA